MRLGIDKLVKALVKLDNLLGRHHIGYIVVGSLADYLLGALTTGPGDIDILVSGENVEKLNAIIRRKRDIVVLVPIRWREEGVIKGLYGRVLLDGVVIDILASVQLRYSGKWILFSYENLLPCTIETRLANAVTVRVPCPEIQAVADKVLGRQDRVKAIEDIVKRKRSEVRVDYCLLTVSH